MSKKLKPKVNKELCKSCGLCIKFCPVKILKKNSKLNKNGYYPVYCIDRNKCLGCNQCAVTCPEGAIEIT